MKKSVRLRYQRENNLGYDCQLQSTDEQRAAFEKLNHAMATIGVMKLFKMNKSCVVRTDACKDAFGAALMQRDDGGRLRLVEYASE